MVKGQQFDIRSYTSNVSNFSKAKTVLKTSIHISKQLGIWKSNMSPRSLEAFQK